MARKILIVDASPTMRKILGGLIQANLNDAVLDGAKNAFEAWDRLQQDEYHLLLFTWEPSGDAWLNFFQRLNKQSSKRQLPAILLTPDSNLPYVKEALAVGVSKALNIPCSRLELAEAINRVCNPITLRHSQRYSLAGTTAILLQEDRSYHASVINIGQGGLFCELDYFEDFKPLTPVTITVNFPVEESRLVAKGLYAYLARFCVLETNADYSPNRIRLAYRFTRVPPAIQEIFAQVFQLAEEQEKQLAQPARDKKPD